MEETDRAAAAVARAPRVTLDSIKDKIASRYFVTAWEALAATTGAKMEDKSPLGILTLCVLVMSNGFVVVGKSAPASPENYNRELGEKFSFEDAVRQVWPLEGYQLCTRLQENSAKAG